MRRCTCIARRPELRRRRGLRAEQYVYQCTACGLQIGAPLLRKLPDGPVPPWNYFLRFSRPFSRGNSKRRKYEKHLKSRRWRKLREDILIRDHYTCRYCGEPATEVDHLNYDTLGNERLCDLVASCRDCNQAMRAERLSG